MGRVGPAALRIPLIALALVASTAIAGHAQLRRPKAEVTPLFSIADILNGVKNVGKRGIQITRFKGLGEMDAKELFETTMNPAKRKLLRVDLTDAVEAEEMFTRLMGDEVEPRKRFIEDNALNVRNLDV